MIILFFLLPFANAENIYHTVSDETCEYYGYEPILLPDVCEEAATALQLNDNTVTTGTRTDDMFPKGCSASNGNYLFLQPNAIGTCNSGTRSCLCLEIVSSSGSANAENIYHTVSDETCDYYGYEPILLPDVCEEAATALQLNDNTVTTGTRTDDMFPKGCSASNGNYLFLQPNAIGTCNSGTRSCLCLEIVSPSVSASCNAKTEENTVKCNCGTNVCDAGEYCNAEQNLCSNITSPVVVYHTVTDETCDHHGYETILLSDVCEEAATALQLNDKTVDEYSTITDTRPQGCSSRSNGNWLILFPNARGTCSEESTCLCRELRSSLCNTKSQQNPVECDCGTNVCDAGEYCNAELNLCSDMPSPIYEYFSVTDETCGHYGYDIILTDACVAAAQSLGLSTATSIYRTDTYASPSFPQTCWRFGDGRLFLATNPLNTGKCSTAKTCICSGVSSKVCDLGEGFFSDLPGLAANGWSGTETTNSDCQACPDGTYSPANDGQCMEKGCTCSDGTAATGSDCPNDGDVKCASCDTGYYLSGNECALKTCTCSHGTAATSSDCPNDGDVKCASCNPGFFLSGNECVLKTCTCSNGNNAKGGACPTHGSEKCLSCDAGYFLSGNECALRTCTCPYGVGATGVACPTHGSEKCISCEDGNHLSNDLCWINWCDCLNGEGERGTGCPNHLAFKCKSCDAGYSLDGTECVEGCLKTDYFDGTNCVECTTCDAGEYENATCTEFSNRECLPRYVWRGGLDNPFDGIDVGSDSSPVFADLDNDGDMDFVSGRDGGQLYYYENIGNASHPSFIRQTSGFGLVSKITSDDAYSAPGFVDTDSDGDLDLVSGDWSGDLRNFWENIGDATAPSFKNPGSKTDQLNPFWFMEKLHQYQRQSVPEFVDLDNDGDMDLVVASDKPSFAYMENVDGIYTSRAGASSPLSEVVLSGLTGGHEQKRASFVDADNDGDLDLLIGWYNGWFKYYENTGTPANPHFIRRDGASNPFNGLYAGGSRASPNFVDLDGDGDMDLVIGSYNGKFAYVEHVGTQCDRGFAPDCAPCPSGFAGPSCERCAKGFTGDNCDECAQGFTGDNCDECARGYLGENCDECESGYTEVITFSNLGPGTCENSIVDDAKTVDECEAKCEADTSCKFFSQQTFVPKGRNRCASADHGSLYPYNSMGYLSLSECAERCKSSETCLRFQFGRSLDYNQCEDSAKTSCRCSLCKHLYEFPSIGITMGTINWAVTYLKDEQCVLSTDQCTLGGVSPAPDTSRVWKKDVECFLLGCTIPNSSDFNPNATKNDGSCDECTCAHGTGAYGFECPQHGQEYCAACSGNFELSTGGRCVCKKGFDEDCDQCAPTFTGPDCDECIRGYAGEYCDQCAVGFIGDNCDTCDEGYTGDDCEICVYGYEMVNGICIVKDCPSRNESSTHKCVCGTTECSVGKYCTSHQNLCSDIPSPLKTYRLVTDKKCGFYGYDIILNREECRDAAGRFFDSVSTLWAYWLNGVFTNRPHGCNYRSANTRTYIVADERNSAYCNDKNEQCICSTIVSAPYCHAKAQVNTQDCMCGTSTCFAGEYCNSELSICSTLASPGYGYYASAVEHCEELGLGLERHDMKIGYERLFSTDACLVGAQELYALGRLRSISNNVQVDTSPSNMLPRSCYRNYNSQLWINTATGGVGEGATGWCSHDRVCICRNVISKPICNAESQVNTGICECGTTVCNAGFYCKSEENLCFLPDCLPKTEANTETCSCGSNICVPGQYCNSKDNLCSNVTSPTYLYHAASSGKCEDYGYNPIVPIGRDNFLYSAAAKLCDQAANALHDAEEIGSISENTCATCVSNVGLTHWYHRDIPHSCHRSGPNYNKLYLSTNEDNRDHQCSLSRICICTKVISRVPCNAETQVNTQSCECGTNVCDAGFYCNSEQNLCFAPECLSETEANAGRCSCGNIFCDTGQYCNSEESLCGDGPSPRYKYHGVTSESCAYHGYSVILEENECLSAAEIVAFSKDIDRVTSRIVAMLTQPYTYVPVGCFRRIPDGGLFVALNTENTGKCSTDRTCICKEVVSAPNCKPYSQQNTETCSCGTSICSPGEYCNPDFNLCSDTRSPEYEFHAVTSDKCEDHGYENIFTKNICKIAAETLFSYEGDVVGTTSTSVNIPYTCYRHSVSEKAILPVRTTDDPTGHLCTSVFVCLCTELVSKPDCTETGLTTEKCTCGTNMCDAGVFCNSQENSCFLADCNAMGEQNTETCKCGTNVCTSGQYCNSDLNLCADVRAPDKQPVAVTDETCDHYGYEAILTDACVAAAQSLGVSTATSIYRTDTYASPSFPQTCWRFNDGRLFLATNPLNTGKCTTIRTCICEQVVSRPDCKVRTEVNTETCLCGTTLCTRGHYCDIEQNQCIKAPCPKNYHVSSGNCEACAVGRFRPAGDLPLGKNTECWPEGSCGGDFCVDANTVSCTNNVCVCKEGFGGTTCERDTTPSGLQQMLRRSRRKAIPTKQDIIERQKMIKTFARDTLRQKIKQGKTVKDAIKETKLTIEPEDLPQKAQAIVQQLQKVPVVAVAPANKDETDTCDQGVDTPGCSMVDLSEESDELVILSTDPEPGSWSVLASGGAITSKQTRVSEFVYEMQCWDDGWGTKETVDVSDGAQLYECNGNVIMISSQAGICKPSLCGHGNCTVDGSSYVCSCEAGWSGTHCDEASTLSYCHEFDCSNYGGYKTMNHCGGTCSASLCCNHATKSAFDAVCSALTTSAEYVINKCCHRDICV